MFHLKTTSSFNENYMMINLLELCILFCKCLWLSMMSRVYFVACVSIKTKTYGCRGSFFVQTSRFPFDVNR